MGPVRALRNVRGHLRRNPRQPLCARCLDPDPAIWRRCPVAPGPSSSASDPASAAAWTRRSPGPQRRYRCHPRRLHALRQPCWPPNARHRPAGWRGPPAASCSANWPATSVPSPTKPRPVPALQAARPPAAVLVAQEACHLAMSAWLSCSAGSQPSSANAATRANERSCTSTPGAYLLRQACSQPPHLGQSGKQRASDDQRQPPTAKKTTSATRARAIRVLDLAAGKS